MVIGAVVAVAVVRVAVVVVVVVAVIEVSSAFRRSCDELLILSVSGVKLEFDDRNLEFRSHEGGQGNTVCKHPYWPRQFCPCSTLYGFATSILAKRIPAIFDPIRFASIHIGQHNSIHVRPYTVSRASILANITESMFDPIRFREHPYWPR